MMSDLAETIGRIVPGLHPERVLALSRDLLARGSQEAAIGASAVLAPVVSPDSVRRIIEALQSSGGVSCRELGLMLAAASASAACATESSGSVELVWTGPTTDLVPVRRTEQVLTGLVDGAKATVFLVSFVAYKVGPVVEALQRAVLRGVTLKILLENYTGRGGSVTTDSMATLKRHVPGAKIFEWSKDPSVDDGRGAVHAKCVVADAVAAFVTSANLTEAAMERNMELGVLLRGGETPRILQQHFDALITARFVREV
jgi:cardiolipin synthase